MSFYLHLEVSSNLSPAKFRERVIVPLGQALERDGLGSVLDSDPQDEVSRDGVYELALEVTDEQGAREVVERVLHSVDG